MGQSGPQLPQLFWLPMWWPFSSTNVEHQGLCSVRWAWSQMHVVRITPLNWKGKMQGKLGDAPDSVIQTGFLELSSFGATLDSEKCHVLSIVKFRSICSRGKSCHLWLHKSLRKILRSSCSIYFTMVHSIFEYQFRHSSVGAWILIKYWLKLYSFYPWQKKVWKQTTVSNNSQKIIA